MAVGFGYLRCSALNNRHSRADEEQTFDTILEDECTLPFYTCPKIPKPPTFIRASISEERRGIIKVEIQKRHERSRMWEGIEPLVLGHRPYKD